MDEPAPTDRRSSTGLIGILAIVALVASGLAAYSWTKGQEQAAASSDPPRLQDLVAGDLGDGDPAPQFAVPTIDGKRFDLAAELARGKPVVLNLWASWCLPCREEMPAIDAVAARHPEVAFIGVAVQDDLVAAERFAREIGVTYPIGLDERDEVNALYPSPGLPVTYIISDTGVILDQIFAGVTQAQLDAALAQWFGG